MTNTTNNLLKAGFVALPAWLGITTMAGFLAAGYNPIESHVSVMTLTEGLSHSLVNIAAWLAGVTLILFSIGVWRLSERRISVGAICMILFGIAMITNGTWPMGSRLHGFYIIGIFNIIAPALCLLDIRDNGLRRKLHAFTAFVSVSAVFYLWLILTGFEPEGYSGLTQRIFGSINYAWPFMFALMALKKQPAT